MSNANEYKGHNLLVLIDPSNNLFSVSWMNLETKKVRLEQNFLTAGGAAAYARHQIDKAESTATQIHVT